MNVGLFIAFLAATALVLLVPGPAMLLIIGETLACGRSAAWPLVAGVALGDATALVLATAGLGALLHASPLLFMGFKLVTAAALAGYGLKMWFDVPRQGLPERIQLPPCAGQTGWKKLAQAYAMTAISPNAIISLMAFLPQFVDHRLPAGPQLLALGGGFVAVGVAIACLYAFLAHRLRKYLASSALQTAMHRILAIVLVLAGLGTALLKIAN